MLHGGEGYAATPLGEVHYRMVGPKTGPKTGPIIVLLHQTPWSMIQYAEIQNCLAKAVGRSLAIDTPGYGRPDAPAGAPSISEYADTKPLGPETGNRRRASHRCRHCQRLWRTPSGTDRRVAVAWRHALFPAGTGGTIGPTITFPETLARRQPPRHLFQPSAEICWDGAAHPDHR